MIAKYGHAEYMGYITKLCSLKRKKDPLDILGEMIR
jgi:hypothetical protein